LYVLCLMIVKFSFVTKQKVNVIFMQNCKIDVYYGLHEVIENWIRFLKDTKHCQNDAIGKYTVKPT
jgi:hypothetical protein